MGEGEIATRVETVYLHTSTQERRCQRVLELSHHSINPSRKQDPTEINSETT
jgi:hypothetical protein